MPLASIPFSDLLLFADGTGRLRGCPGAGPQLVPVPEDCVEEVRELPALLKSFTPSAMRYHHRGVTYRVARIEGVDRSSTWFLRRLADTVPAFESLGLQPFLTDWLLAREQKQGLVLFSGPQGSGKTTAGSAYIVKRLELYGGHAITLEYPAELPLGGAWGEYGHCVQSEIDGEPALAKAIEQVYRHAAPVILYIGEIRTAQAALEVLRVALSSSQQLVVATIHGLSAIAALERLVAWARGVDHNASQNLADSLLAIIHLSLDGEVGNTTRKLTSPGFLLLPFNESDEAKSARAKLRENTLTFLHDDMRQLRNRIANDGGI